MGLCHISLASSKWLLHVFQQYWFTDVLFTFICCGTVSAPQGSSLNMSIFLSDVDGWWLGEFGQQRWVWAVTGAGLVWVKVNSTWWAEPCGAKWSNCEVFKNKFCAQSPEPRAGQGPWSDWGMVSKVRWEWDCTPIYNSTEGARTLGSTTCDPIWSVLHISPSLCSPVPCSSSCSLPGACINHLFIVRLMNLLPEILIMIWENQWNKERLLAQYLGRSLLTGGVIFLLPMVGLEAVNVMQHSAAWNEWCGTCQVLFQGLESVSETLPLQWTYGKEWKRMGKKKIQYLCVVGVLANSLVFYMNCNTNGAALGVQTLAVLCQCK